MKMKKWGVVLAAGALVASLGMFGCSSDAPEEAPAGDAAAYTLVADGVLTVGLSPDYPPFENIVDGELVGFDVELGQAIAAELGLAYEAKQLQFDAIVPAVAAGGQCDIGLSGFSVDPERAKTIDFTNAYYVDDQAVAVMKGGEITADNAAEALNAEGVVIAVQTGTTGEVFAQENYPNATIKGYGNSTDCFAAMQAGQATAVCTNAAVVNTMLAEAYTDAEVVQTIATGEEYAIVVSQDNPELTAAINAALATLTENGTVDALLEKWF